eukprot:10832985-Prorocentrum_lima.AAC.1
MGRRQEWQALRRPLKQLVGAKRGEGGAAGEAVLCWACRKVRNRMTATEIEHLPHLPSWVDAEAVGARMSANDPWPAQAVAEVAQAQPLRNHRVWTRA